MPDLEGGTEIVTGASTGIGEAAALRFAEAGAEVVVADVNAADGEETVAAIEGAAGATPLGRLGEPREIGDARCGSAPRRPPSSRARRWSSTAATSASDALSSALRRRIGPGTPSRGR